jgi:purine-binding chemotaxis protein CheW
MAALHAEPGKKIHNKEMLEVQQAADMEDRDERDAQDDLYLTFTIGSEVYGIGIEFVKEIIGIQPIAEIPDFPEHIRGVINLRGKIIPVMDVRLRFRKPMQAYDTRTCIIVVDISSTSIGLIVDRVAEVVAIPAEEIAPPPEINRREAGYIQGFGKAGGEIKRLLDLRILLSDETSALKRKDEGECA